MTDQSNVEVVAAVTFIRNLRLLAKKYRSIHKDIQPVIEELENGAIVGEQVPNIGYAVFKVRVRNRDVQKGKSGGYRLIYYLQTTTGIILLSIYSKSDQANIDADEIRSIIKEEEGQI